MNRAAILWRVASILVAAGLIAAWQLAANLRLVSPVFLPGPDRAWAALVRGFSSGDLAGKQVRLVLPAKAPKKGVRRGIQAIHVVGDGPTEVVDIDPPLLTALMPAGARQKQRRVPLAQIPKRMQQAVLAIEDQSFYSHPGINPFRLASVAFKSLVGGAIQGGPIHNPPAFAGWWNSFQRSSQPSGTGSVVACGKASRIAGTPATST